jgi:hypothetical protein
LTKFSLRRCSILNQQSLTTNDQIFPGHRVLAHPLASTRISVESYVNLTTIGMTNTQKRLILQGFQPISVRIPAKRAGDSG